MQTCPSMKISNPILPLRCPLKSRNPFLVVAKALKTSELSPKDKWQSCWEKTGVKNQDLIPDPIDRQPGFIMPCKIWITANHIRTSRVPCSYLLNKWQMKDSSVCDCEKDIETMEHLMNLCPLRSFSGGEALIRSRLLEAIEWMTNLDVDF